MVGARGHGDAGLVTRSARGRGRAGAGAGAWRGGIIKQRIVSQLQGLVCGLSNLASCWLGHADLLLIFLLQVLVLLVEVLLAHVPGAVETVQQLHRVQPPAVPPRLWRDNITDRC